MIELHAGETQSLNLYAVAAVFMKKGVKLSNIFIFRDSYVPVRTVRARSRFTLTRLAVDIPGIMLIALTLNSLLRKEEARKLYEPIERKGG